MSVHSMYVHFRITRKKDMKSSHIVEFVAYVYELFISYIHSKL